MNVRYGVVDSPTVHERLLVSRQSNLEMLDAILFHEGNMCLWVRFRDQGPIGMVSSGTCMMHSPLECTYRIVFSPSFFKYPKFSGLGYELRKMNLLTAAKFSGGLSPTVHLDSSGLAGTIDGAVATPRE